MPIPAAIIVAGALAAGATVASSAAAAKAEEKSQKSLLEFQERQVANAEAKASQAESLAEQAATDKIRKARLAKTTTILTSPLGLDENATVGTKTLLGSE